MNNIAIIPARGGSKGIYRKNIKLFYSKPLIYWSIKTAQESKYIDRVIVSTDDEEIADISRSYYAEVPFMRPAELARDNSLGIETVLHALDNLSNIDKVLLLQPTSPLRRTFHINEIFELKSEEKAFSAVSISVAKKNIDLYYSLNSDRRILPFSKVPKLLPRQAYLNSYTLNGALYLSDCYSLLHEKSFISSNTVGYIMSDEYSVDIDTQLDWEFAEFLMHKLK